MIRPIRVSGQFERDLKKAKKRGKDLGKLWAVVEILRRRERFAARHRPHKLSGEWHQFWECHVEPDWLLVWRDDGNVLFLARSGSHSDLFG